MSEPKYHDSDGSPCTLDTLCRLEPEWAANRIRALLARESTHIWVDGPDGALYHCSRCAISKVDDHDAHTCQTWKQKLEIAQLQEASPLRNKRISAEMDKLIGIWLAEGGWHSSWYHCAHDLSEALTKLGIDHDRPLIGGSDNLLS